MTPTVLLENVTKTYSGRAVVENLSLALHPGELVALVGHNGAGKTTQIKMMLGLTRPDSGRIQVLGQSPDQGHAARRDLGYLPESVQFHLAFTGRETLGFYARLKGLSARGHDALFQRVGLGDAADRPVRGYSKGMRQRLGLAQALLGNPRLLLLDEPTSGLDPALRRDFYRIVRDLAQEGATVFLCSHALAELEDHADRVIVLNRGRKIADGTMADLRRLADLPSQIQFRMEGPLPVGLHAATTRDGRRIIELPQPEKLPALGALLAAGVSDLTVTDPSLDDVYAHFLNR